ncbi:Holin-like protein CidA [Pseudomonas yamanorum]
MPTRFWGGEERMLLRGLTWLVLFQLLGTAINHLFVPVLPGPIIGLLLMLAFLVWRGEVGEPLSLAASSLLRYLPLLLVPPAVGVMVYAKDIAADFWAIVGALVLSLVIAMGFVGVLMQQMVKRKEKDQ